MDAESVTINCWEYAGWVGLISVLSDDVREKLERQGYKIAKSNFDEITFDFQVNQRNVKITITINNEQNFDVCLVAYSINYLKYVDIVKRAVSDCKQRNPTAPIIVAGEVWSKNNPRSVKKAELVGWKSINKTMGYKLAKEVGAVKYIKLSLESGRGYKIMLDEIYFAYLGKLKDDENRRKGANCNVV